MASQNKIHVSLTSKETPIVALSISDDSGSIVASATDITPAIKLVATGPQGPDGVTLPVQDGTITSAKIVTNAVTTSKINDGAVSETKLKYDSVSTSKIINGAVTNAKIAADAINGSKIADNSIGAEHIIDGTVTAELLTDGIITADKYGDLSIATAKLKDLAVTSAKLASNLSLEGTTTVKHLIGLGTSPFTITGPATDNFELISNQDLVFQVDANQATYDGSNSFIWKNGSGTQIAALDESGNLTISGTVDGLDISSLQNLYPTADATKVGFLTVTQAVNLDTLEANVATNNAKNTYPTADATKVGYLQITQSVDLDLIETNLAGVINKTQHISVSQTVDLDAMETKLNGIAAGAQVNYALIDSDTMSGALATNVASAESIKTYVDTEIAGIVDSAPGALNTLNELAAALGDDANFSTTVTNNIATKAPLASPTFTGTVAIPNIANVETAIAANTAKVDLTVDGAGTIHANNVPTLNQSTTGNAATATALAAGNQTIDGDVNIGASQAGHDFTLHGATTQFANIVWDASMNFLKVADASKIVFGNGLAATDFDSSIQADGSNLVIYNDTGNVQIGDTVEITGDLTVTGTVDGIDIATDVAANTAKTSFPGFGTTAGTALEGNTTIPTQYTDANAVSAVATADDYLKNDANDTMSGSLTLEGSLFVQRSDGGNTTKTKLVNNSTTGNKTLDVPDASGVIALTNSLIDTKTAAYWSSSTAGFYITLSGASTSENTSLSTASYTLMYVVPFDGKIKRISSFHQSSTSGTSTFEMYIDGDDDDLTNDQRGSDMTTSAFTRKFTEDCPADWTFSKGEAIAIKRTDSTARYGVTMTIVFEYDTTT